MAMYEYECTDCGASFELLRNMNQDDSDVVCKQCGSSHVKRKLSVFASVATGKDSFGSFSAGNDGGSCSTGLCGCSGSTCGI